MLEHGGRLREAARRYGIPPGAWLDLSTGIHPQGWPVPALAPTLWQRLPEEDDGLEQAAAAYYGTSGLLPVAGSQAALQALPRLRPPGRVGIASPGYAEHAHAWQRAGHSVVMLATDAIPAALEHLDVLVVIQPNNPTGELIDPARLLEWQARLAARGGWLVVDEAFIDATPDLSLAPHLPRPGLWVLRSLGKFFGLAGARVGFALGEPERLAALREELGPWPIAHPARHVATLALRDRGWQEAARIRLAEDAARLGRLLARHGLPPAGGCALFQWVLAPRAARIHEALAQRGILTRLFGQPASLRFGLPGEAWDRLEQALAEVMA